MRRGVGWTAGCSATGCGRSTKDEQHARLEVLIRDDDGEGDDDDNDYDDDNNNVEMTTTATAKTINYQSKKYSIRAISSKRKLHRSKVQMTLNTTEIDVP